jgi:hypothetical protein
MLDALQDYRLGGTVDPANCAPVAVPHSDPVLVAAERSSRGMRAGRFVGESLHSSE